MGRRDIPEANPEGHQRTDYICGYNKSFL